MTDSNDKATEREGQGHTPGPWSPVLYDTDGKHWDRGSLRVMRGQYFGRAVQAREGLKVVALVPHCHADDDADAHLIAAAPDMLEALRLHQAWSDSEDAGPDYGGQSRDTHPDGEKIWRAWWDNQLDLCGRATKATRAAIAKAEGRS